MAQEPVGKSVADLQREKMEALEAEIKSKVEAQTARDKSAKLDVKLRTAFGQTLKVDVVNGEKVAPRIFKYEVTFSSFSEMKKAALAEVGRRLAVHARADRIRPRHNAVMTIDEYARLELSEEEKFEKTMSELQKGTFSESQLAIMKKFIEEQEAKKKE